jgi:hypothetical protein
MIRQWLEKLKNRLAAIDNYLHTVGAYKYRLVIPPALYEEMRYLAVKYDKPMVDVIKAFVKLGFVLEECNTNGGAKIVIERYYDLECTKLKNTQQIMLFPEDTTDDSD